MISVEEILQNVPELRGLQLDMVFFEAKYPIIFTCKNENQKYLFSCCAYTSNEIKWIGVKTDSNTVLKMLQNKIMVREAFIKDEGKLMVISYNGQKVICEFLDKDGVSPELLPTEEMYFEAEEGELQEEMKRLRDEIQI